MANASRLKDNNMLAIINVLREKGPLTKSQIAKYTGLTSVTVHNFINEFADKQLVYEEGIASSNGGRKATLYSFNSKLYYIIGVFFTQKKIFCGIFDLNLKMIERLEYKLDLANMTVEEGIRSLINIIKDMIKNSKVQEEKILGLGISAPGPVNYEKGLIFELASLPKWKDIPLKDIIERELGHLTIIDKDMNGNALVIKNRKLMGNENVIYIYTKDGLGTGVIMDGKVLRGNREIIGEIGHITADINGKKCSCGNRGCLELYASDFGIINNAKEKMQEHPNSEILKMCNGNLDNLNIEILMEATEAGNLFAKKTFEEAAKYIRVCLDNVIKIFDPDEIVLDNVWLKKFKSIFDDMLNSLFENSVFIKRGDINISLDTEDDLPIMGAAMQVIENQFSSAESCKLLHLVRE